MSTKSRQIDLGKRYIYRALNLLRFHLSLHTSFDKKPVFEAASDPSQVTFDLSKVECFQL